MALSVYVEWLLRDMLRNHGTWTINASDYLGSLLAYDCIKLTEKEKVEKGDTTEDRNIILFYTILPPKEKDGLCAMVHVLKEGRQALLADSLIDVGKLKGITISKAVSVGPEKLSELRYVLSDVDEWFKKIHSRYPEDRRACEDDLLKKQCSISFDVKPAIKSFTGRKQQLDELHQAVQKQIDGNNEKIQQRVVLAGLGGVGKTQLIRRYVDRYANVYDYNVVWIAAENRVNLLESFYRLAENKLKINPNTADGKKKDTRDLVEEVYQWFNNKTSLFVFDNAEQEHTDDKVQGIGDFLPAKTLYGTSPYIIITSRNKRWNREHFTLVRLLPLTDEEALGFIKKELKINDDSQDEAVYKLSKTLQNLPLALQQAVSYIETTDENIKYSQTRFTIRNYLEEYEELRKVSELLKYEFPDDNDNFKLTPTYFTWKITTDKFKNMGHIFGTFALRLLNISAYCAPNKIPIKLMFLKLAENNVKLLGASVGLLKQYSMVTVDDSYMSVHRLVQDVTRLVGVEEGNEVNVIKDVSKALNENFPTGDSLPELEIQKELKSHFEQACRLIQKTCDNPRDSAKNSLETYMRNKIRVEKECLIPLLWNLSVCYLYLSDSIQQIQILQRHLQYIKKYYGPSHINVSLVEADIGNAYGNLGKPQITKDLLEKALAEHEKRSDHFWVAINMASLADAYGELGDHKKRRDLLENALETLENYYGCDHVRVAGILTSLSDAYRVLGNSQKQKELLEKALRIAEKHYDVNHFKIAMILIGLSNVYFEFGDYNQQKELLQKALCIQEKYYGSDNFQIANTLTNLAVASGGLGDTLKEKELLERALEIQEKYYGSDHFKLAVTLVNLGKVYGVLGNHQKRKELLERSLKIQERHYGSDHSEVAETLIHLACVSADLNDGKRVIELLEEAFVIANKDFGPEHLDNAKIMEYLGIAYAGLGNPQKGRAVVEKVVEMKEKHYGSDHFEVANPLISLGIICEILKDYKTAKSVTERALKIFQRYSVNNSDKVRFALERLNRLNKY